MTSCCLINQKRQHHNDAAAFSYCDFPYISPLPNRSALVTLSQSEATERKGGVGGRSSYSYSCQDLIWIACSSIEQNASMKAEARRALVINGMLWSIAPRRIL